jgi:pimeloyl-ACP methyl ester carboxylesterase
MWSARLPPCWWCWPRSWRRSRPLFQVLAIPFRILVESGVLNLLFLAANGFGIGVLFVTKMLARAAKDEGRPYSLVVLDPLARFAAGEVEKDNAAAGAAIRRRPRSRSAPRIWRPGHGRGAGLETDSTERLHAKRDGHFPQREAPGEVAAAIVRFLAGSR